MLKNHFPMRVVAYDADGVPRNVANLHDIMELAKEKAERYADEESRRYLSEVSAAQYKADDYDRLKACVPAKVKTEKAEEAQTNNEGDTTGGEGTEKVDEAKVATAKAPAAKKKEVGVASTKHNVAVALAKKPASKKIGGKKR